MLVIYPRNDIIFILLMLKIVQKHDIVYSQILLKKNKKKTWVKKILV